MNNNLTTHYVPNSITEAFMHASGSVPYQMTNDYLFRAVFQSNEIALKGLICALLHFESGEVKEIVINNPVEIGKSIDSKEFVLDLSITLNNYIKINLEMQVANKHNWPERSLSYACRSFDDLNRGDDYLDVKPVVHIGFLDYELFPEVPEFFAAYKFMNVKNFKIFSDKLVLYVVNLNRTNIATEEDKAYGIDDWARLFKATTWEEIRMLAEKNSSICEAANAMYDFTADEVIREHCRMREEYIIRTRCLERWTEKVQKEAEENQKRSEASLREAEVSRKEAEVSRKEAEASRKEAEASRRELDIANKEIERLRKELEMAKRQK